jgi:hypothetical protein
MDETGVHGENHNNVVTQSCAARICELLHCLVIRDIFLIMKLVN